MTRPRGVRSSTVVHVHSHDAETILNGKWRGLSSKPDRQLRPMLIMRAIIGTSLSSAMALLNGTSTLVIPEATSSVWNVHGVSPSHAGDFFNVAQNETS